MDRVLELLGGARSLPADGRSEPPRRLRTRGDESVRSATSSPRIPCNSLRERGGNPPIMLGNPAHPSSDHLLVNRGMDGRDRHGRSEDPRVDEDGSHECLARTTYPWVAMNSGIPGSVLRGPQ